MQLCDVRTFSRVLVPAYPASYPEIYITVSPFPPFRSLVFPFSDTSQSLLRLRKSPSHVPIKPLPSARKAFPALRKSPFRVRMKTDRERQKRNVLISNTFCFTPKNSIFADRLRPAAFHANLSDFTLFQSSYSIHPFSPSHLPTLSPSHLLPFSPSHLPTFSPFPPSHTLHNGMACSLNYINAHILKFLYHIKMLSLHSRYEIYEDMPVSILCHK